MKKLISFVLALVIAVTAVPSLLATAEDAIPEETAPAFVVDGILDQWYRDDEWAIDNECYLFFNHITDATMDVISKKPGAGNGVEVLNDFYEDVQVKIYVAYDDHYAYFYVDVLDPHIADKYVDPNNGSENAYSQYIENIDFYIDTDFNSCDGEFHLNCESYNDADTHFRMIAHNKGIVDCKSQEKYIFEQENCIPMEEGKPAHSAVSYFKHESNTVPFHKFDDAGNLIGYGCETRVPLAYWYGEKMYQEIYYHIAVANSATEDDPTVCAIATGQRWWLAYDTGRTVYFDPDEPNPFLGTGGGNDKEPEPDTNTDVDTIGLGDPNDDGQVDAKDALIVLRVAVGKMQIPDEAKAVCDVNNDQQINAKDALEILKYAVGKPSILDAYYAEA